VDIEIRGVNYELADGLEQYIGRRLSLVLGRFAGRIGRVTVRFSDVNGPRGGVDKLCHVMISLVPRGVVRVEGSGDDPFALVANTAKRAGHAVGRNFERRRRGRILRVRSDAA
jgi:putative sigma-54 modulation protein